MTNAIPQHAKITAPWRVKNPGIPEFTTLINLIGTPALLIDCQHSLVVLANSQFCQMAALTQAEIKGSRIADFLPGYTQLDLTGSMSYEATLTRQPREPLQVMVSMTPMNSPWALLNLVPLTIYQQEQARLHWEAQLFQALNELANLTTWPGLTEALSHAIQITQSLLKVDLVCIYKAENEFPRLYKLASSEDPENAQLPETITSVDLIRLREPAIWQPGQRVSAELHRTARQGQFNYLATVPLGQTGAWFGMLVIGDHQVPPHESLLSLAKIIGAQISACIEHYVILANYADVIQQNKRSLIIQRGVAEYAQEGVIIMEPDLTILEMNPAAELILGYTSSEVNHQPADNILIGTETLSTALNLAASGIGTPHINDLKLHRRDGVSFPAHAQTVPVKINEQVAGIILFLTDTSEYEQIRVETQQLEQRALLGEVTAIFAHEVRNPINNISSGLQLMAMKITEDDPNQEVIARLSSELDRLDHLMDSVLTYSKPKEIKNEPTDMSLLIQRIMDRWRPRFAHANVIPYFNSEAEHPMVSGDPRALEQVFTNLISNAIQALNEKGGTLSIKIGKLKTELEPPQYELTVSDNGPGIPDDVLARIFKPFVTTKTQGTGLGLAITKQIITAHRGSIDVNSFPGGTVFIINLPAILGSAQ